MKTLWITPWFGNYRVPIYNGLKELCNNNFHLICSSKQTSDLVQQKLRKGLGDNVVILDNEKEFVIGNRSTTFANKCIVIKWQKGLYSSIKKINPDVVIVEGFGSWSPAGVLYSILHRKKLCMFYERTAYVERNAKFINKLYRKFIGLFVDVFLVNGKETESYLRNQLGFKNTPIQKGCMAADSKGLSEAIKGVTLTRIEDLKNKHQLKDGLTFLFVGQLVKRKGIEELLAAWEEHVKSFPNDNLMVIGTGILKDELLNKYSEYNSVHILGGISYDILHEYYALADVFIMPTLEDNWCLVLPEAMACGLPVACSIYNGGTSELIIDGENGYSFDPKNKKNIIDTLSVFHKSDLKRMGKISREIESKFNSKSAITNIYNGCNNDKD